MASARSIQAVWRQVNKWKRFSSTAFMCFVGSLHFEPGSLKCCPSLPHPLYCVCLSWQKENGSFDLALTPIDWLREFPSQSGFSYLLSLPISITLSLERVSRAIETLVINVTQTRRVLHGRTFSGGPFGSMSEVLNTLLPFDAAILLLGISEWKLCMQVYVQQCSSQHYL